jgi:hypothetical protein
MRTGCPRGAAATAGGRHEAPGSLSWTHRPRCSPRARSRPRPEAGPGRPRAVHRRAGTSRRARARARRAGCPPRAAAPPRGSRRCLQTRESRARRRASSKAGSLREPAGGSGFGRRRARVRSGGAPPRHSPGRQRLLRVGAAREVMGPSTLPGRARLTACAGIARGAARWLPAAQFTTGGPPRVRGACGGTAPWPASARPARARAAARWYPPQRDAPCRRSPSQPRARTMRSCRSRTCGAAGSPSPARGARRSARGACPPNRRMPAPSSPPRRSASRPCSRTPRDGAPGRIAVPRRPRPPQGRPRGRRQAAARGTTRVWSSWPQHTLRCQRWRTLQERKCMFIDKRRTKC